jgi:hypothetical protein
MPRPANDASPIARVPALTAGALSATALSAMVLSVTALSVTALSVTALSATAAGAPAGKTVASGHSLLQSRELWATVDICNPANQPNMVGIRGSMPSDGHDKDAMYMRFQLQYLEAKGSTWVNLVHGGDSGFIAVGAAKTARQGGTSFQLMPVKGSPAYTMRGLVTFQWHHGAKVLHEVTRATSAGHHGVANADPPGYSAAECTIG